MTTREIVLGSGWVTHLSPNGSLHIKGITTSHTIDSLISILSTGNFPENIRGNFALIWIGNRQEVFAVDHLCTVPIFFSETMVSPYFHKISGKCSKFLPANIALSRQIEFLGGFSFGSETNLLNISRIPAGHYYNGKQIVRYMHSPDPSLVISPAQIENAREYFLEKIENFSKEESILFLSSGQDSWTIFEIIKYLGLQKKFTYLHLYSERQIYSERKFLKTYFERYSDLNFLELDISFSGFERGSEESKNFFEFWKENPFAAKFRAAKRLNLHGANLITGEIGTGEFHGSKLFEFALQTPEHQIQNMANLMAISLSTCGRVFGYSKNLHSDLAEARWFEAFENVQKYLLNKIELYKNSSFKPWPIFVWTEEIGSFRLFHYSQDEEFRWLHPYADANFFLPAIHFNREGATDFTEKFFYSKIFESLFPQRKEIRPKLGLSIPSYEKLRNTYV